MPGLAKVFNVAPPSPSRDKRVTLPAGFKKAPSPPVNKLSSSQLFPESPSSQAAASNMTSTGEEVNYFNVATPSGSKVSVSPGMKHAEETPGEKKVEESSCSPLTGRKSKLEEVPLSSYGKLSPPSANPDPLYSKVNRLVTKQPESAECQSEDDLEEPLTPKAEDDGKKDGIDNLAAGTEQVAMAMLIESLKRKSIHSVRTNEKGEMVIKFQD